MIIIFVVCKQRVFHHSNGMDRMHVILIIQHPLMEAISRRIMDVKFNPKCRTSRTCQTKLLRLNGYIYRLGPRLLPTTTMSTTIRREMRSPTITMATMAHTQPLIPPRTPEDAVVAGGTATVDGSSIYNTINMGKWILHIRAGMDLTTIGYPGRTIRLLSR